MLEKKMNPYFKVSLAQEELFLERDELDFEENKVQK